MSDTVLGAKNMYWDHEQIRSVQMEWEISRNHWGGGGGGVYEDVGEYPYYNVNWNIHGLYCRDADK